MSFTKNQKYLVLDYETYSEADLRLVGAVEYSKHPSTEIICVAWRLGIKEELSRARTRSWVPGCSTSYSGKTTAYTRADNSIDELLEALVDPSIAITAHNAFFERCITRNTLPKYFPKSVRGSLRNIPRDRYLCTASLAASLALPRSLEGASNALGLSVQKDMEGRKLLLKMCKPKKPSKKDPSLRHNRPEDIERLTQYCITDVDAEVELFLRANPLTNKERSIWLLDQKINERGFKVDTEMVDLILKMIDMEIDRANRRAMRLTEGKISSATKRAQVLSWLEAQGTFLPDLRKDTVENTIANELAEGPALEMLKLRQIVGKTSVAKFPVYKSRTGSDGRLRDILLYHGAGTGRWSGVGIQPQNFPRSNLKRPQVLDIIDILENNLDNPKDALRELRLYYGEPMPVFSSLLRPMIKAPDGHILDIADYASIEARVLFWVAKHERGLEAFRKGKDLYIEQASLVFNMSESLIGKDSFERFIGKGLILGCIGEGTQVLTHRGWKAIEAIKPEDKLWDGDHWVCHQGLLNKGLKETWNICGIWLTPDHQVLCGTRWQETSYLAQDGKALSQALATAVASLPLRVILEGYAAALRALSSSVIAAMKSTLSLGLILRNSKVLGVTYALKRRPLLRIRSFGNMRTRSPTTATEHGCLTVCHPLYQDAIIPKTLCSSITGVEGLRLQRSGEATAESSSSTLKNLKDGMTLLLRWTVSIITVTMLRGILGLSLAQKICLTVGSLKIWKKKSQTFDIALSGPNNRFTVLTAMGPLIVHNCGYQLGAEGFVQSCINAGREIPLALAKRAVSAYRVKHAPVVKLWSNLEKAATAAVKNPGKIYEVNHTKWFVKKDFLYCQLPSGRRLAYYKPSMGYKKMPWGENKLCLFYYGVDNKTRRLTNMPTYGGHLTENVCQAIARDIMAEAMLRIEGAGWNLVLTVHDELIGERKLSSPTSNTDFCELMAELPEWAEGLPLKVEGFESPRYMK